MYKLGPCYWSVAGVVANDLTADPAVEAVNLAATLWNQIFDTSDPLRWLAMWLTIRNCSPRGPHSNRGSSGLGEGGIVARRRRRRADAFAGCAPTGENTSQPPSPPQYLGPLDPADHVIEADASSLTPDTRHAPLDQNLSPPTWCL